MSFKVGDSVKRTSGDSYPAYGLIVGDTFIIESIEEDEEGCWLALEGVGGVSGNLHQWYAGYFELIKEEKDMNTFDIKDLKTGQRVTTVNGSEFIVITNSSHTDYDTTISFHYKNGKYTGWETATHFKSEIVKVENPDNIQKVLCTYWGDEKLISLVQWTTVWEKPVPLTPEQIKPLQAKYDAAKKELEELGKALGVSQ